MKASAVTLVLALVLLGAGAVFVPTLMSGPKTTDGTHAAEAALRSLSSAQSVFREGDKDGDHRPDYATLSELRAAALIDEHLGSGVKQGYRFQVQPSTTAPEERWFATASPLEPGVSGTRYFCTNQAGAIFYSTSAPIPMNASTCAIPSGLAPVPK